MSTELLILLAGAGLWALLGVVVLSVARDLAENPWKAAEERERQEAARRLGRALRSTKPSKEIA